MLGPWLLLLLLAAAPTPSVGACDDACECGRLGATGREVKCGPITATFRPPLLRLECHGEVGADELAPLGTFDATRVSVQGCPLPQTPSTLLVRPSAVEYLTVDLFNFEGVLNLTESTLRGLDGLKHLQISAAGLTELPAGLLDHLGALEKLDLRQNKLRTLPPLPQSLKTLELGHNLLTAPPLTPMPKLVQLNVWQNRIAALAALLNAPHLKSLDISGNGMKSVASDAFAAMPNLTELNLSKNNLKALPPGLFQVNKKLKILRMNDNEELLHLTPGLFANLPSLGELQMQRSSLAPLPSDLFRNSTKLANVTLTRCRLQTLPADLFDDLPGLRLLVLSNNQLTEFPNFSKLNGQLKELILNNNRITELKSFAFSGLGSLERLNMSGNGLTNVASDAFTGATALHSIDLANNNLSFDSGTRDIFGISSPLGQCISLETLVLRNNSISEILADWTISLVHLKLLDLRANKIHALTINDLQFVSNELSVDLRQNNISIVDLHTLESRAIISEHNQARNVTIYMDGASIDCQVCAVYGLMRYLKGLFSKESYSIVDIKVNSEGSCLQNYELDTIECPVPDQYCPAECVCGYRPEPRSVVYRCDSLPDVTGIRKVAATTELWLQAANLSGTFNVSAYPTLNLTEVRLSGNRIKKIVALPAGLRRLELDNNRLQRVSPEVLEQFNKTHRLTLAKNPWACDCDALELLNFVQRSFKNVTDLAEVACDDGRLFATLTADDLCAAPRIAVATSLAVAAAAIILGSLAAIYYKYQRQIKVWLYAHNLLLWLVTETEVDKNKKYDAFISYSHKDEAFVVQQLLPGLEPPFKLCIHARDWNAGDWIPEQIARSVEESRRTLVVLSPSFLESVWGKMEFRTAHQQAMSEGRARVLVVLLSDVGPLDKLDPELRAYLSMNTYLEWGDPWFWSKLRYAMPHRRLKGERPKQPRPLAIKINDKLEQLQNGI